LCIGYRNHGVAKQITAYLAVLAARSGSLDLGAPVADFLSQMRVPGITVTDLIRHHSGIRDAESLLSMAGFRELDHYTSDDLLALAYRQADRAEEPGRFLYSNTNYLMLAKILETIHGTTLQQLADQLVFAPLGMHTAHFKTDSREVIPHAVSSYKPTTDDQWQHQARHVTLPGPGSLWCSAHDLDCWLGHLHQEWAAQGFHAPPFDAEISYLHSDADHVASHIVQCLTHGGTLDEIHACLGAFAIRAGTAPKHMASAAPTDPPALADQLARTCAKGQTYAGPGYTLTIPATDTLTNGHLNTFTLDLVRAPALHYRLAGSSRPVGRATPPRPAPPDPAPATRYRRAEHDDARPRPPPSMVQRSGPHHSRCPQDPTRTDPSAPGGHRNPPRSAPAPHGSAPGAGP
jgi:Beta-lactamase